MTNRLILLTNDDGVWAPGLDALAEAASKFGKVVIVAPDRNRSAISSAMSVHDILRIDQVGETRYVCDGTPVDCVLAAIYHVLDAKPDWILAGVNCGYNLGEDVMYSGTVGAAFEGRLQGIKSAAISLHRDGEPKTILPWLARFLENWESIELPPNALWNVNIPEGTPKGFKLATQGRRKYSDMVEKRLDPRGKPYYWIGGEGRPVYEYQEGNDADTVSSGYIALTPLQMDLTCREIIKKHRAGAGRRPLDWLEHRQ